MTKNILKAIKGLEMYVDAIGNMNTAEEFDSIYNYVVKNGLSNMQIENLLKDIKENYKLKKINKIEALKGLEEDHRCENCGRLLILATEIYTKEYNNDSTEYFCECVVE